MRLLQFPMQLYFGDRDYLIGEEDARKLIDLLRYCSLKPEIKWMKDYAHLDYVWSLKAKEDIYTQIREFLDLRIAVATQ